MKCYVLDKVLQATLEKSLPHCINSKVQNLFAVQAIVFSVLLKVTKSIENTNLNINFTTNGGNDMLV